MIVSVYVPYGKDLKVRIAPGSGIVGVPFSASRTLIYYEGNIYNAVNIKTFEDKIAIAAGRLAARYPTVAKTVAFDDDLMHVGTYDTDTKELRIDDKEALDAWLERVPRSPR